MDLDALTPAQRRAYDELFAPGEERPVFASGLADDLAAELDERLAPAAAGLLPGELHVNKTSLARIHQCERYQVESAAEPFAWSVATARGTVAHKAVELSVFVGEDVAPAELVDLALERIVTDGGDWSPRSFLLEAPPLALAELRAEVTAWVTTWADCFPPLQKQWRPRLEAPLRVELCAGRVTLRAKPDLGLGRARGEQAGVLLVDFKTGRPWPGHVDDLRFYALVEAIRSRIPPFRVASYYLDAARWHAEDVTEASLRAALERVVRGVTTLVELGAGVRPPVETPGPACTVCPVRDRCDGARQWRDERDALGLGLGA